MSEGPDRFFCFDLASPLCYLAAERVLHQIEGPLEWLPVSVSDLPQAERFESFRCAEEERVLREDVQREADALGLPLRWPDPFPFNSSLAMRVATYAKGIGRTVPFAQAAFRQAFAGGHALDSEDFVLISAAACEMHPQAVVAGARTASTAERLRAAGSFAAARGVHDLPAIVIDDHAFCGRQALELVSSSDHAQARIGVG